MKKYCIPTGYILVDDYSKGKLETLSIGDYGKSKNIKADFIGYHDEINGVASGWCKPLSEKLVITVSTQFGCQQNCRFCDCPNVTFKGNATFDDLKNQFYNAIKIFPEVKYTDRLNLHYARMGEPIFNKNVFEFSEWLYKNKLALYNELGLRIETIHPVLTTSLPKSLNDLSDRINHWCDIKNNLYNGQAGLQISVNSTNEVQRQYMFSGNSIELRKFATIANNLPMPIGRKYCLNFAYSSDYEISGKLLASMFDSEKFMCKITPIHNNNACKANDIETIGGYDTFAPYKSVEEELKASGFDVLIFVPSMDEENGLVTCGNAILGGGKMKSNDGMLKIRGINR